MKIGISGLKEIIQELCPMTPIVEMVNEAGLDDFEVAEAIAGTVFDTVIHMTTTYSVELEPPKNWKSVLGLGEKFCIQKYRPYKGTRARAKYP